MDKYCPSCKQDKALSEFSKDNSRRSGLRTYCRECCKPYQDRYYAVHRDRLLPRHNITATRSYYKRKIKALMEVK